MPRSINPRPLFLVLLTTIFITLVLNAVSQALPRLFTASNVFVELSTNPTPPVPSVPDATATAFIATHPATMIGFWRQCNAGNCQDLQLPCGDSATSQPTPQQVAQREQLGEPALEFTESEGDLCPRMNAARVLMALSLFAGVVSILALVLKLLNRGSKIPLLFALFGTTMMAAMHLVALILLATVKQILDKLADLSRILSPTGTSTPLPNVTTIYQTSASFYVLIAAVVLSLILLPLVFIVTLHPSSQLSRTKGTSTTTLPLSSFPAPPRMVSTSPSITPLTRNSTRTSTRNSSGNPRYYSGSTTVSAPQTVIGAPVDYNTSSSSSSDETVGDSSGSRWRR
ncbi:hypothetical protein DFJ77DRAFT_455902 [Powellomyces hirtus]|nr:hypothetical protein DFJ77DRAFT_455902 [Powellomyces hirtus]